MKIRLTTLILLSLTSILFSGGASALCTKDDNGVITCGPKPKPTPGGGDLNRYEDLREEFNQHE